MRQSKRRLALSLALTWWCCATAMADTYFKDGKPIDKNEYDAGILVNQGTQLLRGNKNEEACAKLKQAVAIAPQMAEAHHDYGLALAKLGRTDEACDQFKTALKQDPTLASTWLSLGGLYQSSGRLADAVKTYQSFLSRFPKSKDAPKVAALVQGLSKQQSLSAQDPAAPASADDYFAEVTHEGVFHWAQERMPIRVLIHSGAGIKSYQPQYEGILKKAFEDWQAATKGAVRFQLVTDPANADIECTWIGEAADLANIAEAGETRLSKLKRSNIIVGATIKLLTVPPLPGLPMTDNRLRTTCLHEIGHALGMNGHTTNPKDMLFFSSTLTDEYRELSLRDANTVIRLYKEQPPIKNDRDITKN